MVLILVCTVSFPFFLNIHCICSYIFRMKFHSLCVQPSSAFINEKSYFKKNLLALLKLLFCFYLAIEAGNWLLHIISSGHYLSQCFCKLVVSYITFEGFKFVIKYSIIDLCPLASQLNLRISLCLKNVFNIFKLLYVQKSNHVLPLFFNVASPLVPTMLVTLLFPALVFMSPINIM